MLTEQVAKIMVIQALGGLVLTSFTLVPRFTGSNPVKDNGFLRATQIRSTPSFGWEVKPEVPCRKILRHVDPTVIKEILRKAKFSGNFFADFLLLRY
jgi:hypothetical protein